MLLGTRRLVVVVIASFAVLAACGGEASFKFDAIKDLDVAAYLPPDVVVSSAGEGNGAKIATQQSPVWRAFNIDLPESMSVAEFRDDVVDRLEQGGWELDDTARTSDLTSTATTLGSKTINGYKATFSISTLHQPPDVTVEIGSS